MAEESLLPSHTEDVSASPNKSSSLLSEISNASTRPFVLAFTVGSCGALSFGCIVGYTAPTQSSIMKDLNLSIADFSFFGSILTVGLILGALICGKLADLVGRVYDVRLLDLGRLLQGISVGISSYLGPIYISELAPRNLRGAASSLMQLFVGVGLSAFYALGTAVAWRSLAILGSIPSLVVLPLLFFIPESPRWLAKVGREKEVEGVLLSLRGAKSDVSDEAATILEYTKHVEQQDIDSRGFFKLFQRKYALPLTIGVVLISMPQLGGLNGYTFYTDTIFTSTDDWRRFRCFACGYIRKTFSPTATAISFFLQKNNCWETGTPIMALISVMVYFGSYGLGMGPIPWIIASEIYPVDVKGAAGTVCNLVTSISSWLVTYSFNFLLQWSSTGTFMMFATVMGLGFVFTAKLVPETKGKSLEEIQSAFTDSTSEDSTIF